MENKNTDSKEDKINNLEDSIKEVKKNDDNSTVREYLKLNKYERGKIASAYALLSQIAIQVIVIMAMMFFLGRWLDEKLGTSPLFLLLLLLLGMLSAFKSIYDIGMNEVKKYEKLDKSYKSYKKYNYDDEDDDESSDF